jgi:multidrug resistance efflux pump
VVQRVPVRIEFAQTEDVRDLRAGMSVTVDIDTGRQNTVLSSLGLTSKAAEPRK